MISCQNFSTDQTSKLFPFLMCQSNKKKTLNNGPTVEKKHDDSINLSVTNIFISSIIILN